MENRRSFIKKSGSLLALSSLSILSFSFLSGTKTRPAQQRVTLYVDTDQISNDNVDEYEYCHFAEQGSDTLTKDFVVHVNVGDTIIWEGKPLNPSSTDIVHIHAIHRHHGKNAFDDDGDLRGGDGQNPHNVARQIKFSTAGDDYKYILSFKVLNRDGGQKRSETFHIDPIISSH